jgi:hypothetical protein
MAEGYVDFVMKIRFFYIYSDKGTCELFRETEITTSLFSLKPPFLKNCIMNIWLSLYVLLYLYVWTVIFKLVLIPPLSNILRAVTGRKTYLFVVSDKFNLSYGENEA